ncbi:MAG: cadmium-translocating P-type ATPase [Deltaproteobacteria bacterium]|nr:cadmium-translocating P-type ATPase [Deltaproteobacteria bacterium]MBW2343364.1 cadmium-translocating P-type ATPase [Deltaproteobacteria bacterium]
MSGKSACSCEICQGKTMLDQERPSSCGCTPGVEEEAEAFSPKKEIMILIPGILVYVTALVLKLPFRWELTLFITGYVIIGGDVVWTAIKNILHGRFFDEFFLMSTATLGAFAMGEFPEAVAVMLFYKVGELLQDIALNRSRKSITSLMEIRPDYANLQVDGETKKVDPNAVNIGDIILVRPGERVPLDGIVSDGSSMVDTSALTGESVPRSVKPGDEILSGMINKNGLLTVRVTKRFNESTVSKILDLVENASAKKAPTEKFITKFARYYTPAVVFGAVAVAVVPVILYNIPAFSQIFTHEETFSEWIYKALIFLVISCPCALVISIPLGFFGGIGAASKRGILVKGSNFLEGLNNLHTVVWDKTGTLTKGVFRVTAVVTSNGFSTGDILGFAAQAESHSSHPIAQSIRDAYEEKIDESAIQAYEEISGYGIKAQVKGRTILAGNDRLLHKAKIMHDTCNVEGTVVHVAIDGIYAGYIIISDEIKPDAKRAIQGLKDAGVKKQIMLTGDSLEIAKSVAEKLGLDEFYAELLPQQKVQKVEESIGRKTGKGDLTAFVGDGINDAPVLIRADIGVAMGALGSDAAIDAADIVLMSDEPSRIPVAVKVAKKTRMIVWQNIFFAMGVKGVFLTMGVFGIATMWEAVFADVGVALLAILNATRILKSKL